LVINEKDQDLIIKRYTIRQTGSRGRTIETSVPREVFEREARRFGLTPKQALKQLEAVWRFNSFHGLHLSFEPRQRKQHLKEKKETEVKDVFEKHQNLMENAKKATLSGEVS
jgi:hypothetical protein